MAKALKVTVIGAGSAQFSLGIVRDLCLTGSLAGSHITFMDIDEERLDMINKLGKRYAEQLGSRLTFDKTTDRRAALKDADFVLSTAYVLGHYVEADMRDAMAKFGYYHGGAGFGPFHQLWLMNEVAEDIAAICPKAWLIQSGNPVFDGCTLMTRETGINCIGLCHGHYHYEEVAATIGLDLSKVTFEAPGFNHNIWMTKFEYEGKDAYPLLDKWIAEKGEEYWRTHVAQKTHDAQMSRSAINQYKLYGLMPIGDTVRSGGWWYHTDIVTKKRWFGEPWGGPDTHLGRPFFVKGLEKRIAEMKAWANDPKADLVAALGKTKTREQIVPIMDGLVNDNEGYFQVNVPNKGGYLPGIPEDVVVEVPATVNKSGVHPVKVKPLPAKIMFEAIYPDWIDMERGLLAYKTGDKSMLLWNTLQHHSTKSYDLAVTMLDELLQRDDVKAVETWEKMPHISEFFKYPKGI